MDLTDAAILRAINWHPLNPADAGRQPYGLWDVARLLNIHGNTVKRRIQDMEASGVLGGVAIFPNALEIGLQVAGCHFRFSSTEAAAAAEHALLEANRPGVVAQLVGNLVFCNVAVPRDADLRTGVEAMREHLGALHATMLTARHWPPADLTDLERRTLWALMKRAFATPPELGHELGVTAKTVRRCMASLRQKRAFHVVPLIGFMDADGLLPVYLDVDAGRDAAAMYGVLRSAPELLMGSEPQAPWMTLTGFVKTQRDLAELIRRLQELPGVRAVRPQVMLSWKWTGIPETVESASDGLARLAEWDDLE